MIKTIEVVISRNGESRIETKGFAGAACQEASRFLESALGAKTSERLTAEYYHQAAAQVQKLGQEGASS
jgi:hypothetical protein